MTQPKARVALSLPGGGLSGALYQVGALAALHDGLEGIDEYAVYVGHAGGSVVAASLMRLRTRSLPTSTAVV